jgi:DNA polymerase III epsilon subunit family exonuclease
LKDLLIVPTEEQEAIIEALPNFELIKVNAFAGTGKTSTLQLLTKHYPKKQFLYLAYNKSIQLEARKRFGKNVQVKTVHSLSYKCVSRHTNLNLKNIANYYAKDFSKQFNLDYKTAQKVCSAFSVYCNSSEIDPEIQPYGKYIKQYWKLVDSGKINPSFDFILKSFHLLLLDGDIEIEKFDTVLLDEAQDSTDVIIDIFLKIKADHKVLVGDKHQQIYSFKDSKNAMNRIKGKELALTKTFRFPTNIAKYSNTLLARFKGETLEIQSDIEPVPYESASNNSEFTIGYISRGNSALITKMLDLRKNNEKFKTVRQPEDIFRTIKDLGYFLDNDKRKISSQNSFLRDLADENDLKHYIKSTKNFQLESTLRIFHSTFSSKLSEVFELESLANEYFNSSETFRYFLTTVHTAKGLEFDGTVISNDFFSFEKIINISGYSTYQSYFADIEECNHKVLDEFNLFYVALTRCKKCAEIYDDNIFYLEADNWKDALNENLKRLTLKENSKNSPINTIKDISMSGILEKRLDEVIYTVFDFETTGMSYANGDKVVELAFVKYSIKDGVIDEFSSLINPEISIPYDASEVHGIYNDDVANAPTFKVFKERILSFIDGTILVAHNVYFDFRFLNGEMSKFGIEINAPHICTMGFPGFIGGKTKQKLENICNENGISLLNAHSALDDTKATVELLQKHIEEAHSNNLFTFRDLKSTKKTYKFISSWNYELPSYESTGKDVSGFQVLQKISRQNKMPPPTVPSYESTGKGVSEFQVLQKINCPNKMPPQTAKKSTNTSSKLEIKIYNEPFDHDVLKTVRSLSGHKFHDASRPYWTISYRDDYETYLERKFTDVANLSFEYFKKHTKVIASNPQAEGCYIATAVYGSYEAPEVLVLRRFRDTVLKRYSLGKMFISFYYLASPSIAQRLKNKKRINGAVRWILDEFVKVIG